MLWKLSKNRTLLLLIALLAVPLLLSGCASTFTKNGSICPPLVPYSPEFQDKAAAELASLPPAPHIDTLLQDYAMTRDQLRACQ